MPTGPSFLDPAADLPTFALRWRRMVTRIQARQQWHHLGVKLWLIQRPFLRWTPTPLPMVSTSADWLQQAKDMVKRRVWPKSWLQKATEKGHFTVYGLKDAITLRQKLGLRMSFIEDPVLSFGIQCLKKKPKAVLQGALVAETQRLLQATEADRELRLRALLGPRGGLPRLKSELVELAVLFRLEVTEDDRIEDLKAKIEPMVKLLKMGHTVDYSKLSKIQARPEAAAPAAAEASASEVPFGMERDRNGLWIPIGLQAEAAPSPARSGGGQDVMSISSMVSTPREEQFFQLQGGDN